MKVLFITHTTDLSGANKSMLQLIMELKDYHNVTPIVICPHIYVSKDKNILTECTDNGIKCISHHLTCFKRNKNRNNIVNKLYYIILNPLTILDIYRIVCRENIRLVHSNSSVFDTGFWLAKMLGIPHIFHLREFGESDFNLVSCIGQRYEKWLYSSSTRLIAISNIIKDKFSCKVKDTGKILTIYNGIKPSDIKYCSQHNNKITQFCIVGRVDEYKNQIEAIKACSILLKKDIKNFHLTIVGKADPLYIRELYCFIEDNELTEYVTFLGQRHDIYHILSNMDCGIMTSKNEAFGRVTIEYQMQNLAVIASDSGANRELIRDKETGLIYTLGNIEELSLTMKYIIENPSVLSQLSKNGYKYSTQYFTSKKNSNGVYCLYEEILGKNQKESI